jgi:hypothetical protein
MHSTTLALCLCCWLAAVPFADALFFRKSNPRAVSTVRSCLRRVRGGQTVNTPLSQPKPNSLNVPEPAVDSDPGDGDSSSELEALRLDGFLNEDDAHLYDDGDFDSYESSEEEESDADSKLHVNLQEVSDSD